MSAAVSPLYWEGQSGDCRVRCASDNLDSDSAVNLWEGQG
ncbi:hypothetical protein ATJ93_3711 [Halopiger aswanensis]|uniref:Uncharacterized protein n=1 Tax=Halopiger aswanensis TaxID=148449 RepID=A0A3R7HG53_9EURY|nr:hypothetical protein ATJ93_3711 [Halopiger aswanensis]